MSRSNSHRKEIPKMAVLMAVFCILMLFPLKTEARQFYTESDLDVGNIEWFVGYSMSYSKPRKSVDLKIEQGEKFNIGKYLIYSEYPKDDYDRKKRHLPLNMIKGTKYISSSPKVISVDNKGQVHTKKTGKSTIKVSMGYYNKYTMNVTVVKKGTLSGKEEAKYWEDEVKEFKKSIPKSLDSQNCLNLFYEYRDMEMKSKEQLKKIRMDGTIQKYRDFGKNLEVSIVVPEAGDLVYSSGMLNVYNSRLDIFDRRDNGYVEVVSMTSDSADNTITLKLKEPLSADQIFSMKYIMWMETSFFKDDNRENACSYNIQRIKDTTADKLYRGRTEAVLGSDTLVVKLWESYYDKDTELALREVALLKGHTYQLKGFDELDVMMRLIETVVE